MAQDMVAFISVTIMDTFDKYGLEAAQDKYRAYFINTTRYARFKVDVDLVLRTEDLSGKYAACIVTE
jgi:hypothetical protein